MPWPEYCPCLSTVFIKDRSSSLTFVIKDVEMGEGNGDRKAVSSSHQRSSYAPWYNVPEQPIVSVEHPFIIKDVDKGLATLGSPSKLEEVNRV